MQNILIDTWFWYTLFDSREQYHRKAVNLFEEIRFSHILLPWPVAYETLRTRFVKNKSALLSFEKCIESSDIEFLDDEKYKEKAWESTFSSVKSHNRNLSMVDYLLRLILEDDNVRIDGFITFNAKDFNDVCENQRIELVSDFNC